MANYPSANTPMVDAGLSAISGNIDDLTSLVNGLIERLEHIQAVIYGPIPMPGDGGKTIQGDSIEGRLQRLRATINAMAERVSAIENGGRN